MFCMEKGMYLSSCSGLVVPMSPQRLIEKSSFGKMSFGLSKLSPAAQSSGFSTFFVRLLHSYLNSSINIPAFRGSKP